MQATLKHHRIFYRQSLCQLKYEFIFMVYWYPCRLYTVCPSRAQSLGASFGGYWACLYGHVATLYGEPITRAYRLQLLVIAPPLSNMKVKQYDSLRITVVISITIFPAWILTRAVQLPVIGFASVGVKANSALTGRPVPARQHHSQVSYIHGSDKVFFIMPMSKNIVYRSSNMNSYFNGSKPQLVFLLI